MRCPACRSELSALVINHVSLDVCREGCGGIWFDNFELQKFDEPHEPGGLAFTYIPVNPKVNFDPQQRRRCPRCGDVIMMRHFASARRQVEVDTCPNCNGCWLDAGEILQLRQEKSNPGEHRRKMEEYVRTVAEPYLDQLKQNANPELARRMRNIVSFVGE